jgi:hypothetical protein
MESHTPRNVVLQIGALIAMYISASFLITLIFGIINSIYTVDSDTYWEIEQASESVRLGIAMLVVFFPTFIILTRLVQQSRRKAGTSVYETVTKWLIYLSLLLGGLLFLGTLVTVLYTFLNGDITERFIYKALTVIAVTGAAFHYYLLDARNYWVKREDASILFAIGVGIIVCTAIAFGFRYIETPAVAREMKLDETQIADLTSMQWQIIAHYTNSSSTLPVSLDEAYDGMTPPTAPAGREEYSYSTTDDGFTLCATFSREYTNEFPDTYIDPTNPLKNPNNWNYKAGRHCFKRLVK